MNLILKHKHIWCCLLTAVLTGITSCDSYLDVKPQGQIDQEASALDPATAEKLVTGVYNTMWEGDMHGFAFVQMTNIASDDADKGSNTGDDMPNSGALDNLTMDGSVNTLNNIWRLFYLGVARANQALSTLEGSTLDEAFKNQLMGEVRFLRAYFYFELVRFFGGVPLVDKILTPQEASSATYQTKATEDEVYAFIIADLEYGLTNLAIKGAEITQQGRATKGAAAGMLAKVMLYRQNWQRAFSLTDSIITQKVGAYGLLDNYFNIFRETGANSMESLFEVQTGINSACEAAIANFAECQAPRAGGKFGWADLGWGFGTPSQSLVDEYEDGDLREAATIMAINPNGTFLFDGFRIPSRDSVENDRYNYKSYHSQSAESNCGNRGRLPKNLRILRFGEVLLIHAEAALALNNPGAAIDDINALHPRAGLGPVGTVTRESIWHERRVEMGMEYDRFFDLIRQDKIQPGRAAAAFAAHGKTFNARNRVFPIPQRQIDLGGGNLVQNDGYN